MMLLKFEVFIVNNNCLFNKKKGTIFFKNITINKTLKA